MMNGKCLFSAAIAAGAVGFISFAAFGATQETWDSDKTDPIVLSDDLEVTVASGTVVCSGEISGGYKLIKKGAGTLVLAVDNSFSGGLEIQEGFVNVMTASAYGTGGVTVLGQREGFAGDCCLRFSGSGVNYAATPIVISGTSTYAKPVIELSSATNTFAGTITAAKALYINDDAQWLYNWFKAQLGTAKWSTNVSPTKWMDFKGAVTAGEKIYLVPDAQITFSGPVSTPVFVTAREDGKKPRGNDSADTAIYGALTFTDSNSIGEFRSAYRKTNFSGSNSMGGALMHGVLDAGGSSDRLSWFVNTYDQTVAGFVDDKVFTAGGRLGNSGYVKTITMTGTTENAELLACREFVGGFTFVLDAADNPGFVQTLAGRANGSFAGTLNIQNGTLKLDAGETFSAVTKIEVGAGGRLIADSAGVFPNEIGELRLTTGGTFELAAGGTLSVTKLFVDGQQKPIGAMTRADCGGVLGEGVTINVTTAPVFGTADWTPVADGDYFTGTLGNWSSGGTPFTELPPVKSGGVKVNLVSGSDFKYGDKDCFDKMTSAIEPAAFDGPLTISPATEGAKLVLANGFMSDLKKQLVLKGHLTTPFGIDKSDASDSYAKRFHYKVPASSGLTGVIHGANNYTTSGCPLVLGGVTVDLPLRIADSSSYTTLVALDGTTNIINGKVNMACNQSGISANAASVTKFMNGYWSGNCHHFSGPGEFWFVDKPLTIGNGAYVETGCRVVFDSTGNYFGGNSSREGIYIANGTIDFRRNNALLETEQVSYDGTPNKNSCVEFNLTTQRVGRANFATSNDAYLHGDYPAMLEMTGQCIVHEDNESKFKALAVSAQVKGGLGFHMMATNLTFTLSGRAFESCGDLIVSAGTNQFYDSATWLNGTNFVMKGVGLMTFAKNGQVNKDHAFFHFAEQGQVKIASGNTLEVRRAAVDDGNGEQVVPPGVYDANSTGLMAGRIVGDGKLKVLGYGPKTPQYVETAADMTASGEDWIVEVDKGCSNVVTVAQTGTGRIIKAGEGTLVFRGEAKDATFTGGIVIEQGRVAVEACNSLGTGEITILGQRADYTGVCELDLIGWVTKEGDFYNTPPTVILSNNVHITGNTTPTYPGIVSFYQSSHLCGDVVADHDFCFLEDPYSSKACSSQWSNMSRNVLALEFDGDVTVAGTMMQDGWATFWFRGKVMAGAFLATHFRNIETNWNAEYRFFDDVVVGAITNQARTMYFEKNLTVAGAHVAPKEQTSLAGGALQLTGAQSTIGGFSDCALDATQYAATKWAVQPLSGAVSLTLTGVEGETELTTHYLFNGALSLTLDAPGFTQVFAGRTNTMSGAIWVKNGTMKVTDGSKFENVSSITVGANGALVVDTAIAKSIGATALTVDGALTIDPAVLKNLASLDLALGENAALTLPDGAALTVKSLTYKGDPLPIGAWTHAEVPVIPEGVTVTATTYPYREPAVTAVWTGEADDGKISTLGNWQVGGEVPAMLDVTSGSTAVIISNGVEMIPDVDGVRFHSIVVNREANSENGPFVLGRKGGEIMIDYEFICDRQAQLVIRGRIATPKHADQGAAEKNGSLTFTHIENSIVKADRPSDSIIGAESGANGAGLPLVLDDAIIEKPCYLYGDLTGSEIFHAYPGTTNIIYGNVAASAGGWEAISVGEGGSAELCNGVSFGTRLCLKLSGALRFTGKAASGSAGVNIEGVAFTLNSTNNTFVGNSNNKGLYIGSSTGSALNFACSWCFKDDDQQQLNIGGTSKISADFGSTTQLLSRVCAVNTKNTSYLTGAAGSLLQVKGGTKRGSDTVIADMTVSMPVKGALGFHYLGNGPAKDGVAPAGNADVFTLTGQNFESCGELRVSGGTLELAADATWKNGQRFVADGSGLLRFTAAGQVGAQATFRFAGNGKIEIPAGVTYRCTAIDVEGYETIETGVFDKNSTGAMAGRIIGDGALKVGRRGMMLIVQ